MADSSKASEMPPLPRRRKFRGVAVAVDGETAEYTEAQLIKYGQTSYEAGRVAGRAEQVADDIGAKIQAEETAWMDYKTGRAPKPL